MSRSAGEVVFLVSFLAATLGHAVPETNDLPLRVWSISQDSMDYVFMSATPQRDGSPRLAFNHRSGRTLFLCVGDKLGEWTIDSHAPGKQTVTNPRTGVKKEVDADRVTLSSGDGEVRHLQEGKLYTVPGHRAILIDIESGQRFDVREGDDVSSDGMRLRMHRVSGDVAEVDVGGVTAVVHVISDDEVAMLRRRSEDATALAKRESERLRKDRERREAEEAWAQNVQVPTPPRKRPQKTFASRPEYFYGTYGPIPVAYTVVPPLFQNGHMVRGAIVVPTRFESHPVSGFGNCPATRRPGVSFQISSAPERTRIIHGRNF